ncbi:phenylalanine--tRNA ligase alpha subunit-like [Clytia hemisphaerica]|uniref:phenylalanine--tRNA ligase n=1 Tax=Clytia hemisphaerica TaxID=252671 RepID=A0A7M5UKR4_9CNID
MSKDLDLVILKKVDTDGCIDTYKLSKELEQDHQLFVGAVKRLQSLGEIISANLEQSERWILTKEGLLMAENGSHEANLFNSIPPETGLLQSEMQNLPLGKNAKIGFSKAMTEGWVRIDKTAEGGPRIFRKVESISDHVNENLVAIQNGQKVEDGKINDLKKRKLITKEIIKSYSVKKGPAFTLTIEKPEADLTTDLLMSGSWKTKTFKDYNFDALGIPPTCGHLHPLLKVRTQYRQIFLEMGFTEMPTNNFVESSFWNFDALFQPQQHPARDAHDTFFLSAPKEAKLQEMPEEYIEKVKTIHSSGGHGSQGYQYDWTIDEAKKNLLRTHTTAVSTRMLYKLAKRERFTPAKYFSIDRVFRNESLDATHLAEFHQIEGVVADRDLSLGHLIGILHEFFRKLGIEKLRFKPAFNPYTEPSMEIFSYHEGLKKWVEIGNSGIFRPEMLLPMGFPKNVSVIAWGLSLERPTMIKYGISNIRDLIGHKIDLEMVQKNPICRLDES